MKYRFLIALRHLTLVCVARSLEPIRVNAMTVDFTAQPGQRIVADAAGAAIPAGGYVWAGTLADGYILNSDSAYTEVRAAWLPFGETLTRNLAGEAGRFSASVSRDLPAFTGKKIFLFIQQTLSGTAPATDGSNITAWGLFSAETPSWTFPDNTALPPANATLITSSQVTQAWGGAVLTAGELRLAVQPISPQAAYTLWAATAFSIGTPEVSRLPAADPDGDGLSNAFECLFETSPQIPGSSPLTVAINQTENRLSLNYPRRTDLPATYESLQISDSLLAWNAPAAGQVTASSANNQMQLIVRSSPGKDRLFCRLVLPWVGP